jgi:antagonist of KipI
MNLRIIKAGVQDTVQDMGRIGWQHLGINPGGAMDKVAAAMANILVGNAPHEAVIEMNFPASEFFFEQPALIAVSGADFSMHVNGEEIDSGHPVLLSKFSILQFHRIKKGARAYLAVHGGFDLKRWLNSCSTHLKAVMGGFNGRALEKDDEIPMRLRKDLCPMISNKEFMVLPWKTEPELPETDPATVFILPGHEWDRLEDQSKNSLVDDSYVITHQSDRMGYQLKGEKLTTNQQEEVVSSAVNFGTLQLLPDGQLIVLMADHQTAGGYPRVAHVISAHHSRLAQMKPGQMIRFQFTDIQVAEDLLLRQQKHLLQLQNACHLKLDNFLKQ